MLAYKVVLKHCNLNAAGNLMLAYEVVLKNFN